MDAPTFSAEKPLISTNERRKVTPSAEHIREGSVNTQKDPKQYECTVCQEMFVSETDLTKHYRDHMEKNLYMCVSDDEQIETSEEQVLCVEQVSFENIHPKILDRRNVIFECDICHKKFSFQNSLIRHYSEHAEINLIDFSGEKEHACGMCHKTFPLEEQLRRHYRCHVKIHECDVCHKKFAYRSSLLSHYRTHLDRTSLV